MSDGSITSSHDAPVALEVRAPWDTALIEQLEHTTADQAEAALVTAKALYDDRDAWLTPQERIAVLERFADLLERDREQLIRQAAHEGGKPWTDSAVEIDRAINGARVTAAEVTGLTGEEVPMRVNDASAHRFAHTHWEPRGVVLAICAFNHPFNLLVHQVICAVGAGCPVLVKPALDTPLSARSMVALLAEAGLPDGWAQLLLTDNDVTQGLVEDPRLGFMSFIGSAKVGWFLRSRLAPGVACALEHGGAAPVVIDDTADIDDAVASLVRGGFYHAGQVCVSAQRIFLHTSIRDQFTEAYVAAVEQLTVGDPLDPASDVGPLIRKTSADQVETWIDEAVDAGAKVLTGGARLSDTAFEPTVLADVDPTVKLSRQEVFGPVVCLYGYDDLEEVLDRANLPDLYFQASVFTNRLDTALDLGRRLHGMAVMINDHPAFRVDWMPFGGHRESGLNLGGIGWTVKDMSVERMIVFRSEHL